MARVVITGQVEDSARWEEGFRTHGELLSSMSSNVTYFSTTDDNVVALYSEPEDLDKFMEVMASPATAEAMAYDGVKRETVQIFVLDKNFSY